MLKFFSFHLFSGEKDEAERLPPDGRNPEAEFGSSTFFVGEKDEAERFCSGGRNPEAELNSSTLLFFRTFRTRRGLSVEETS